MALGLVLMLIACSPGREEEVIAGAGAPTAIPPDVPGASRAELARVPEQFPLEFANLEGVDAVVSEHQGRETVMLSLVAPGRADASALLLADELTALGWNVDSPTAAPPGGTPSFRFEGFGWSGETRFEPRDGGVSEMVVEFTATG